MEKQEHICIQTGAPCGYPCFHGCPLYKDGKEGMNLNAEIAFSWDWKDQPDVCKIVEAAFKLQTATGQWVHCYNVITKCDSYGIILSVNKYKDHEALTNRWWELLRIQNGEEE